MDYFPNFLGSGSADFNTAAAHRNRLSAATPPLQVRHGNERGSHLWIAVVVAGFFLLLPMLADLGCGFAPPGTIVPMQHGDSHCLWQIGAKGYRFPVDREGRITEPAKGICAPTRQAAGEIADALNRRLPIAYAECLDRRDGGTLQFWTRAIGFY